VRFQKNCRAPGAPENQSDQKFEKTDSRGFPIGLHDRTLANQNALELSLFLRSPKRGSPPEKRN
jgi:hypothetical protein